VIVSVQHRLAHKEPHIVQYSLFVRTPNLDGFVAFCEGAQASVVQRIDCLDAYRDASLGSIAQISSRRDPLEEMNRTTLCGWPDRLPALHDGHKHAIVFCFFAVLLGACAQCLGIVGVVCSIGILYGHRYSNVLFVWKHFFVAPSFAPFEHIRKKNVWEE
jgi:hypothetical protein